MDSLQRAVNHRGHCSKESLVEQLRLEPHPEGGWFREVHRSAITVQRADGSNRCGLTVIWFLLAAGEISRWHRVRGADETWHHAGGDPLELWLLPPTGGMAECRRLGPLTPPTGTHPWPQLPGSGWQGEGQPIQVVPADWWQAARCQGDWSLVTCCVGPGFAFEDFELLHHWPAADHPPGALAELL
jgi:predicted cupin superfamily sugar epimerase